MDTLFNTSFESVPSPHTLPNVKLKSHTYQLQEKSVRLKLTICDTVGYGDQINKDDSFKAVVDYIDSQFESYLQEELKIKRSLSTCHDSRIHICLYFICPTGKWRLWWEFIRTRFLFSIFDSSSIDCRSWAQVFGFGLYEETGHQSQHNPNHCKGGYNFQNGTAAIQGDLNIYHLFRGIRIQFVLLNFQSKIIQELSTNGVQIYQFPTDDETVAEVNVSMNTHVPFAVVGSTEFVRLGNKTVRARQYPWGTVQGDWTSCDLFGELFRYKLTVFSVDNEAHCDFVKLREMLIRTNMEDMREKTHTRHYELYRQKRLEQMGFTDVDSDNKPVS